MWKQIDNEMDVLIYGNNINVPQGKWVVLRIFRHNELSIYWNNDRQEAIGGPKYKFDDYIIRTIETSKGLANALDTKFDDINMSGFINSSVFAISGNEKFKTQPRENDILYKIDKLIVKQNLHLI